MHNDRNRISALLDSTGGFDDQPPVHVHNVASIHRNTLRQQAHVHGHRKQSFWPWPGLIFVLLGMNVLIVSITVYSATSDRSFAVEPDYYRKAMAWDQQAAQRVINDELGWAIAVMPGTSGQPVLVELRDAQNGLIAHASVQLTAFHHAYAHTRLETTLEEVAPGRYSTGESLTRLGIWELRFVICAGNDTFTAAMAHDVNERKQQP